LFSLLSSPDSVASVFVCQIDEVETKFLSANSISEFSHSLGHKPPARVNCQFAPARQSAIRGIRSRAAALREGRKNANIKFA